MAKRHREDEKNGKKLDKEIEEDEEFDTGKTRREKGDERGLLCPFSSPSF